jgi:hypothetical protein
MTLSPIKPTPIGKSRMLVTVAAGASGAGAKNAGQADGHAVRFHGRRCQLKSNLVQTVKIPRASKRWWAA